MKDILPSLMFALLSSSALALLAYIKKSLTAGALLLAWLSAAVIGFLSGWGGFLILTAVFIFTIIADKIGRKKVERRKSETRRAIQIVANVGTGTLSLVIAALLHLPKIGFFLYASAMASSLADSMASGIGVLQKRDPVNIVTFHRIPRGRSGGVSLSGLLASVAGSLIVAAVYLIYSSSFRASLLVMLAGVCGALADSILGATLQGKFVCSVDGTYTEKRLCHGKPALRTAGIAWIDNNTVNLLNNVAAVLFGGLLYYILI